MFMNYTHILFNGMSILKLLNIYFFTSRYYRVATQLFWSTLFGRCFLRYVSRSIFLIVIRNLRITTLEICAAGNDASKRFPPTHLSPQAVYSAYICVFKLSKRVCIIVIDKVDV